MPLNRRAFLTLAGSFAGALGGGARADDMAQTKMQLWPKAPPGGGGPTGQLMVNKRGTVWNVAIPSLDIYVPARPNGSAMLVAPGGGYKVIALKAEGFAAAQWLVARGITACILTYRLPQENWPAGPLAPLLRDLPRYYRCWQSARCR